MIVPFFYGYGRCFAPAGWSSMKLGACNRLYVVYGGSGWYMDGGKEKPFVPGHFYFFPYQIPFQVRQKVQDPLDHMYFDFSLTPPLHASKITEFDLASETRDPRIAALSHMAKALELLLAEHAPQSVIQAVFVASFELTCQIESLRFSGDNRIEQVLERIHMVHPDGTLDLPDNRELADLLHVDVNHFIRLFKREVGMTPYQYIRGHRLNTAAACIEEGGTLSEAAHLVGYESAAALSHAMQRNRRK